MTVNPINIEVRKLQQEAASLLQRLQGGTAENSSTIADDLLLYCYRLRDEYRIARSSNPRFHGPEFSFLQPILYALESDPDGTLTSPEYTSLLTELLKGIITGAVRIERRSAAARRS